MANKYTAHPIPSKQYLESLYFNENMTQEEVGKELGVTQKVVFGWFKKLGIKSRVAKKRNQWRENNSSWKHNQATYAAYHYRVEAKRGKPSLCEVCETTKAKRFEWANINGKYEDTKDYVRMCKSCHARFDGNIYNIRKEAIL